MFKMLGIFGLIGLIVVGAFGYLFYDNYWPPMSKEDHCEELGYTQYGKTKIWIGNGMMDIDHCRDSKDYRFMKFNCVFNFCKIEYMGPEAELKGAILKI